MVIFTVQFTVIFTVKFTFQFKVKFRVKFKVKLGSNLLQIYGKINFPTYNGRMDDLYIYEPRNRNTREQKFFHISTVYFQLKSSPIL